MKKIDEEILQVLHSKSIEKPIWISDAEVYWSLEDIRITEEQVKQVLDDLTKQNKLLKKAERYQLTKVAFQELHQEQTTRDLTEKKTEVISPFVNEEPFLEVPQNKAKPKNISSHTPLMWSKFILTIVALFIGVVLGFLIAVKLYRGDLIPNTTHWYRTIIYGFILLTIFLCIFIVKNLDNKK